MHHSAETFKLTQIRHWTENVLLKKGFGRLPKIMRTRERIDVGKSIGDFNPVVNIRNVILLQSLNAVPRQCEEQNFGRRVEVPLQLLWLNPVEAETLSFS